MSRDERLSKWRTRNADRALRPVRIADPQRRSIFERLQSEGIAVTTFETLYPDTLWHELVAASESLRSRHPRRATDPTKPFKAHLLGSPVHVDEVFARIALDEGILEIVAGYLGMRPLLRALDIWLTFPTEGPPVTTQLWHRDGDDFMNVKLFVYLTEVDLGAGPFCFAPRTHPMGSIDTTVVSDEGGRSDDGQMDAVVPSEDWMICTGPPGTVIVADTCGYHKQMKPDDEERVLLMAQYTSGQPAYPPDVEIVGARASLLSPAQRWAIDRRDN